MDLLTPCIHVVRYLRDVAKSIQQNREECLRLADHADEVLGLIDTEIKNGASSDIPPRLKKLKRRVNSSAFVERR
jgi:hypothetical protein